MTCDLLLLRHGKSDWEVPFESDEDRPLARRGRRAAELVGKTLERVDLVPDLVITSSALRARDTVERAADAGKWGCPVEVTEKLYGASPAGVLEVVRRLPPEVERVLLVGHEPTWSSFLAEAVGGGDFRFPTAALALVRFHVGGWDSVEPGTGELQWLLPPRLLQQILGEV